MIAEERQWGGGLVDVGKAFIDLRDRLLQDGLSPAAAARAFDWPQFPHFNWARDYFDRIAAGNDRPALRVVDDAGLDQTLSFAALARRSDQVANYLAAQGVGPGDRVLSCWATWSPCGKRCSPRSSWARP